MCVYIYAHKQNKYEKNNKESSPYQSMATLT